MGKAKARVPAMTPAERDMFLRVLGETGNVSEAARAAGCKGDALQFAAQGRVVRAGLG